jgi:hypothetical protein
MIWSDLLEDLTLDLTLTNGHLQLRPPHRSYNLISMLLACRQMYVDLSSVWKSSKTRIATQNLLR